MIEGHEVPFFGVALLMLYSLQFITLQGNTDHDLHSKEQNSFDVYFMEKVYYNYMHTCME